MAFVIEETFEVESSVDRVWRYLLDARRVVECLPGAELTDVVDDRTFTGRVKVKVGPVVASYQGRAQFVDVDALAHRVRIVAEGRERAGPGSAKMTMTASVSALPPEGAHDRARVEVRAELDLAGKIVQFGRGMIDAVNRQLFAQFASCVREQLRAAPPDAAPSSAPSAPLTAPPVAAAAPRPITPADVTRVAPRTHSPVAAPSDPQRGAEPVRLVPLLWRVLRERVARLVGRGRR